MKRCLIRFLALTIFLAVSSLAVFGQGGATAPLTGLVLDQSGAVVSGAIVVVKNNATGAEFNVTTANNGTYTVPALGAGLYTVTVESRGFKKVVLQDVKIDVGVPATANVTLEIGEATESVVVQGAGEVLQTQTANITTTIQTKQIAHLPLQSRNSIYFLTMLPGVSSSATASPRNSTINGLPSSAYNVTIDGLNTQDNFGKNGDGFFSYISPSVDAIQEVTLSTATPGAESAGQGAIQIKFATRSGSNEFHGSLYEYHRNTALNSNYWYTNRDTSYNVEAAKPCGDPSSSNFNQNTMAPWSPDCRAQRAANLFNQFGGRVGGPIVIPKLFNGRDRAFFFVNYEEFRQPNSVSRTRTILTTDAQAGIFKYAGGPAAGVNVLDVARKAQQAGCAACTTTVDPTIAKLLADIRNSTNNTGGITSNPNPNLQFFSFNNSSMGRRYLPTVRFDFNLTDKHRLENTYNYQSYVTTVDALNSRDPQFPGFPNRAGQFSNRFANSLTLRSTLTPSLVNEARVGFDGGTLLFFPDANAGQFTGDLANQAGFNLGGNPGNNATGIAILGINGPTNTTAPSRRNSPVWDFANTTTWTRGAHSISLGGQFTQINTWLYDQTLVPTINFGLATGDPALAMFNNTNFPGIGTNINAARNFYAVLTGRVTAINANAVLDEKTDQYQLLGPRIRRFRMREWGFFAQDSWRARPNLTLTGGMRYELQLPYETLNGVYNTTTINDLFGVSGSGNLFNPNAQTGRPTQFVPLNKGERGYNTDLNNFAPSIGFAWSLNAKYGWLKRLIGDGGQTVLRGGYSIAFNRQGGASFSDAFDSNPGISISASRSATNGRLVNSLAELPVLLRETSRLGPDNFSTTRTNPLVAGVTDPATGRRDIDINSTVNIFEPNIQTPYNQSFTIGIQRELSKDMAIEVRYVHTRNLQQWVDYNLNEVNIVENGFLQEFKNAQKNLQAFITANPNCGQQGQPACSFAFRGLPGQSPLPIYLAYFQGAPASGVKPDPNLPSSYTSGNFTSSNFYNPLALNNPLPLTTASSNATSGLFGSQTLRDNAVKAGLSPNFFLVNPDLISTNGVNFTGNGGYSRYDGLQVDFRRRLSRGLLVEANYTWAKSYNGLRDSFRTPRVNAIFTTNGGTLAQAFKANWVYELPIGKGKMLLGNPSGFAGGLLDRVLGGWEWSGSARIQTGANIDLGNVNLVGMTRKDLQKAYKLRFDDANKQVFIFPQDIIDNSIKAFDVDATTSTGYANNDAPTGRYIAPANGRGCIQVVEGDCGFSNLFITGPKFTRFDLSLIKRFRIRETMNFELRGEFLNAFNNINFLGNTNLTLSNTANNDDFGLVTSAYRDINNTQDPGGRLIQIVARFNF